MAALSPLAERILDILRKQPGQLASRIAELAGVEKLAVIVCVRSELAGLVAQSDDYRWSLAEQSPARSRAPEPVGELARLARYYLECISQDMDGGVSVFASSKYGAPDYAGLNSVSFEVDANWWRTPDIQRVLGKVAADRNKLVAWLGYPVRLRRHTTPKWDGFFVEPVLLWAINLPATRDESPSIDERWPAVNPRVIRGFAMGDTSGLAEECARLAEELGFALPDEKRPPLDELIERLVNVRSEWDWQESIDPTACPVDPSLADISEPGIYNRAVIVPGERSPYTQGLETELKALMGKGEADVRGTALTWWLNPSLEREQVQLLPANDEPLLEVLPMNSEQRAAIRSALAAPHTVITGPPGTGKSQVVTNLLINAAWRGMRVLFASKNNKAVDVVESRVNGLGSRPILLRLGARELQERLGIYLSQLLAGSPSGEEQASYEESLERHRLLAAENSRLDKVLLETMEARNIADRCDEAASDARSVFGPRMAPPEDEVVTRAPGQLQLLEQAVSALDPDALGLFGRIALKVTRSKRLQSLVSTAANASDTLKAMGVSWPGAEAFDGVEPLRARLKVLRQRVELAKTLNEAKRTLTDLRRRPGFEGLSLRRVDLIARMQQNSERLWREWVSLAPSRLTPADRKNIAEFSSVLAVMNAANGQKIPATVRKRAEDLSLKVTGALSCWAVTSLSARGRIPLEPGFFDLVVFDEASQCDIASALPLLFRAKRSVVIGDPMQLKHISALTPARDATLQQKYDLVESRLAWMYSVRSLYDVAASFVRSESLVNLRDHHRSHADIIGFSNQEFYENRLRIATRYDFLRRPRTGEPGVVWTDVKGSVARPREGGAQNRVEAEAVVAALIDLLVRRNFKGSVGVVTPFRAQAQLLQNLVHDTPELEPHIAGADLLIDTVHRFQGDERDVMIFSTVVAAGVSQGALGFLRANGNLFNVAITRARGLLHVVGDRQSALTCGVDYLERFATYVDGLSLRGAASGGNTSQDLGSEYPPVSRPERVSDWERVLYRAMYQAGLRPVPQFSVEQYDLDFALFVGNRKLAIEVDGERYHRSWTGELVLRDQIRNMRLIELGWEVKRFWVPEIRDDVQGCVGQLRDWASEAN